jgi:hypothetical protein
METRVTPIDACVGGRTRTGIRRADASTGDEQLRTTERAGRLVRADSVQHVAALDALRLHD